MSLSLAPPRTRRRRTVVAVTTVVGLVGIALPSYAWYGASAKSPTPPWLDTSKSVSARVNALLKAMTLAEKVGQMDQQLVTTLTDTDGTTLRRQRVQPAQPDCMQKILIDAKTGSILAGGTNNPIDTTGKGGVGNTGYDWANEYNIIQQYAIKNSRLHIPLIFGVDAVHGFGHPWQAPLYPQSIGMGATWDPARRRPAAQATAEALRATGWTWDFAPVQDLARDNRWGRTYETWAEEPALASAHGRRQRQGPADPAGGRTERGRHGQALRGLLAIDQRP